MVKQRVDLEKRLDDLLHEPEPPVAVTLQLNANLYRLLKALADGEHLSLEAYLVTALNDYAERAPGDVDE